VEAFCAAARLLVDEADTFLLAFVEGLVGVFDSKSDVMHAALTAILLNERGYCTFRACGFEKFDFHVSDFEKKPS